MYPERTPLVRELEAARRSKVMLYVTGDRPGLETQIASDVYHIFVNHLDLIGVVPKISLFLYTRGGDTLTAWSVVNLIRQFCEEFEVIVPSRAHSAGTLMSLGANTIVMTKQATLGPIDPSVNTPLNPQVPGGPPHQRFPVSVEAINGFLELAKEHLEIKDQVNLTSVLVKLSNDVHPLVLGHVYRSKSQIQMLARKLIARQVSDQEKVNQIISFLCSESGSHDYTIHRREARDHLGLKIEKPDDALYALIKRLYDDVHADLQLTEKFDPNGLLGANQEVQYSFKRALLESVAGGSDYISTEGRLVRTQIAVQPGVNQTAIQDERQFEGWRHDNPPPTQHPTPTPTNELLDNSTTPRKPNSRRSKGNDSPPEPRKSDKKRPTDSRGRKKT